MKIKAEIYRHGVEFSLIAECEYEHAMLKFLCSSNYDVKAILHDAEKYTYWRSDQPTRAAIHLCEVEKK